MDEPVKICTDCGIDLNGQKRVKDPGGNYYCHACWGARREQTQSKKLAGESPTAAVTEPQADVGESVVSSMQPTSSSPRDVPAKLWWKAVVVPAVMGGAMTVSGWALYISSRFFHYDPLGSEHTVTDDSNGAVKLSMYLGFAVFLTLVGVVGGWWVVRSQLYTIRYGPMVIGRISGLASLTFKGARKVVVDYEVGGKIYKYQGSDGAAPNMLGLDVGDEVKVYVHPNRPKRSVVLWERPEE